MEHPWMVYGANGFTGRLIAREAHARGLRPVLAGRNRAAVEALAHELGFESRIFPLDGGQAVPGVEGMSLVLHAAGPYSATSRPMFDACLANRAHYLDITGEIAVFEALHARDTEAVTAGILVAPGVGFDVVPTDCLAAGLAACINDPLVLELAFRSGRGITHGTAKGIVESLGYPNKVRRDGILVDVPMGTIVREIPFSDRVRTGLAIPWGDVSTAYYSTGIPNITVFRTMNRQQARKAHWIRLVQPLLRTGAVQRFLKRRVDLRPEGPSEEDLRTGTTRIWGEVTNAAGDRAVGELTTGNAYAFTAHAAVTSVERLLGDVLQRPDAGFVTPSMAFGADFISEIPGVTWTVQPAMV